METTPTTITTSKKYSLDYKDLLIGALIAAGTVLVGTVGQVGEAWLDSWVNNTVFTLDKLSIAMSLKAAFAAASVYLIKNFFRQSRTVIVPGIKGIDTPEPPEKSESQKPNS